MQSARLPFKLPHLRHISHIMAVAHRSRFARGIVLLYYTLELYITSTRNRARVYSEVS